MGMFLQALDQSDAEGRVYFTNVSDREGVLCLVGTAINPDTQRTSASIPACEHVNPYASVSMKLKFAGGDLFEMCKGVKCRMTVEDAK
jgi:hypothetical protein